jgi:tetratricopeptide (TPR) repeat protein
MGDLSTLYPPLSPMLWTSIATGKYAFNHGVWGFTEPDPETGGVRPVTSLSRTTRSLWNILQLRGLKSNVIGWWPSHPAEPVDGVMVTERYHRAHVSRDGQWPMPADTVHPARLREPLAELRVDPRELTAEHIGPFVPEFHLVDQEKDHRLEAVAKILAECSSIHAAATAVMQLEPWDFMAVYYDALDHFGHGFMRFHPPQMEGVSDTDFRVYKNVVGSAYRYHDMMLGALLRLAGPDTTVILVSDHGFHPDDRRPQHIPVEPAGPAVQHRQHGILVMKGPGIKEDERVYGANLLDITPTILRLFNLPVGEDMDGMVLSEAFESPPPHDGIPSWDLEPGADGGHPADRTMSPMEAHDVIAHLVDLGYIEQPDENLANAAAESRREQTYNLARSYMGAGRHLDAIPLLEELTREWPDMYRFALRLVTCCQTAGKLQQARDIIEDLVARKHRNAAAARRELAEQTNPPEPPPENKQERRARMRQLRQLHAEAAVNVAAVEELLGVQTLLEGNAEDALIHFRNLELMNRPGPATPLRMGQAYAALKRWADAEEQFRTAIDRDDTNTTAWLGLTRACLAQRQNRDAAEAALNAIGLDFNQPEAHFHLGIALHRMGRLPRAVEALNVTTTQNPRHVQAHERLAHIFEKRLGNRERAQWHRERAAEARKTQATQRTDGHLPHRTAITAPPHPPMLASVDDNEGLPAPLTVPLDETVVIVSGLPRSGTSMMMQMLHAGGIDAVTDSRRQADAFNAKGYYEDERVKRLAADAAWLTEARGKALKIVIPLFLRVHATPDVNFRVVLMERPIPEIAASQKAMLRGLRKSGAKLDDEQLQKLLRKQLDTAKRALATARIPVLLMPYEDCLKDPEQAAARLNTFLGGKLDREAMARAVQPALRHYRQTT